jgi:hypothetical protein
MFFNFFGGSPPVEQAAVSTFLSEPTEPLFKRQKVELPSSEEKLDLSTASLTDDIAHRFLLLFMRADKKNTGALSPRCIEEIAYMPTLGKFAEALRDVLKQKNLRRSDNIQHSNYVNTI